MPRLILLVRREAGMQTQAVRWFLGHPYPLPCAVSGGSSAPLFSFPQPLLFLLSWTAQAAISKWHRLGSLNNRHLYPGWGGAQWTEYWTKWSLVRFPVTAHAWVVGQVPSWGHARGNHTLMFLSSFSLPSPLSKNK